MKSSDKQTITYLDNKLQFRPFVSNDSLKDLLLQCYGLEIDENVAPKELDSYDDRNFLVQGIVSYT